MGDYTPIHSDWSSTATTSAAVTGGRLVAVSGDGTVAHTAGADTAWLGVAGYDADSGAKLDIEHGGTQELVAAGAIAAGAQVVSAADGKVASLAAAAAGEAADVNAARQVVGVARTAAADADDPVRIQMER
jgi:hypothetical protein